MSTFSSNVTQKIAGGGAFGLSAGGTILTTGANQYAKVRVAGTVRQNNVGSSSIALTVGGTTIRSASTNGTGSNGTLHNERDPDASGSNTGVETFEVLVPPSSNLVAVVSVGGVATVAIQGTFVIFENTP